MTMKELHSQEDVHVCVSQDLEHDQFHEGACSCDDTSFNSEANETIDNTLCLLKLAATDGE
jgi:hypothetical protein